MYNYRWSDINQVHYPEKTNPFLSNSENTDSVPDQFEENFKNEIQFIGNYFFDS